MNFCPREYSFCTPPQPICGKRGCSQTCPECCVSREERLNREMARKGVAIPYTQIKHPARQPLTFTKQVATMSETTLVEMRALPWSPYKGIPIVKEGGKHSFGKWGRKKKATQKARELFSTPRTTAEEDCRGNGFLLAEKIGEGSTSIVRIAQAYSDRHQRMLRAGLEDPLVSRYRG